MSPTRLMSLTPRLTPRQFSGTARRIAAACGVGVLALGATACGSDDDPTNAAAGTGQQGATTQDSTSDQGGQRPGANGTVAAVSGSTAQVQSQDGQVAVTWNGTTTFTRQVAASLADVEVGSCVMVQPADDATSSGTQTTEITAGTVRITAKASDGTCAGGFGGGPGGGPGPRTGSSGAGGDGGAQPPSGGGGRANGAPQIRGGFGATGAVTAVSATGFTVKATVPDFGDGTPSAGSTPTMTEQDVTVTVNATTTYTTTGKATASDVKVGSCLRAVGTTDDTGAVTAKTVALSPAVDGECGMVFRRGTPPDGSGGGSGPSTQES